MGVYWKAAPFWISIHAPVKGATYHEGLIAMSACIISIHAPVKGATFKVCSTEFVVCNFNPRTREGCDAATLWSQWRCSRYFNPRTREGCDKLRQLTGRTVSKISIHAPVKGATIHSDCSFFRSIDFNPRTREGCDH